MMHKKTALNNLIINKDGLTKELEHFTKFLVKSLTYFSLGIMAVTSLALAVYSITGGC